jgi:hypothetical protein
MLNNKLNYKFIGILVGLTIRAIKQFGIYNVIYVGGGEEGRGDGRDWSLCSF